MRAEVNSITDLGQGPPATGNHPMFTPTGWRNDLRPHGIDIRAYGALGDGLNDDSLAIQAAIDAAAAAGGGKVICPVPPNAYRCNVILKSGVTLEGGTSRFGYLAGATPANITKFIAASSGVVIDTPVANVKTCGVVGINVYGLGAGTPVTGIRFRDVDWGFVKGSQMNNIADEGLRIDSSSIACVVEDVLTTNCVLNRTRAAVIGAIDLDGTDHYVHRVQAGISGNVEGTVQSVNLYCVALAVRSATSWFSDLSGEISDIGIYVSGSRNVFSAVRADLNYGHGFYVMGLGNRFIGCLSLTNSQDTHNTYSNFHATAASGGNVYSNCLTGDLAAKKAKYGFEDLVASAASKNQYTSCVSSTAATADYIGASNNASSFSFPRGSTKTLTANATTPSVSGYEFFLTANSSPTTITAFTGGVAGQRLTILCNDANTSIQHNGSTIVLMGPGNKKLRSGGYYEFIFSSNTGVREIAPFGLGVTADVGNAAKVLQARINEETQIWNTALTATRVVTLSTTGAFAGARFRIVRGAGATGAFNLDIGTGPLKSLTAAGQWADVEHDGTNWVLTAAGAL